MVKKLRLIEDSRPGWSCTDDMVHRDGDVYKGVWVELLNLNKCCWSRNSILKKMENIILELDEVVDVSVSKKDNLVITGAYVVATLCFYAVRK